MVLLSYCWIEQPSTYPEENPSIDGKREAEAQTYIKQLSGIGALSYRGGSGALGLGIGDLSAGKSEEEEEKGTGKLPGHGNEVIADGIGTCNNVSILLERCLGGVVVSLTGSLEKELSCALRPLLLLSCRGKQTPR